MRVHGVWKALLVTSLLLHGIVASAAQDYPTKPIRLVVAWGTGGAPDSFARVIGQK